MNKLIVVIMGPGKKHFAEICIDSVKDADEIHYWTNDFITWDTTKYSTNTLFHINGWNKTDPATNGKCRNNYLEHLKENYPEDWCLVLDEDEIVEDLLKIKEFIQVANPGIYNVKMRHLIGNLGMEDNTQQIHVVPGRLFKISEAIKYPEHSHPILEGKHIGNCMATTIWHLGHLPIEYMDYILKRYKQHAADSQIHTPEFLKQWKMCHLLGQYPVRPVNPVELPKQILDRYELDRDEFYFANRRQFELKHILMMKNWLELTTENTPNIIDIGCGVGHFGHALDILKEDFGYNGFDKSKYAIENSPYKGRLSLNCLDAIKYKIDTGYSDLVLMIDILEHLEYDDLDKVINNFKDSGEKFVVSIPFIGDPNLEADPTHIIKETKEWWIKQFTDKGLKLITTPKHFLFKEQIMIFKK